MMSLIIRETIDDRLVDVKFDGKLNILKGNSATGKSYLMHLIYSYIRERKNRVIGWLDYKDRDKDIKEILNHYKSIGVSLILIDNADIFMTWELFNYLDKLGFTTIVSLKNTLLASGVKEQKSYHVIFDKDSITLKRGV